MFIDSPRFRCYRFFFRLYTLLVSYVFDGNHREVVTLLGAADELMDGIGHVLNQFLW